MSKSVSSPSARLLRSSRVFSLPRPLPPAQVTATSTGVFRESDSATSPYPTYQAIATPASSHFRGDWGLKRALPKRATNSSTPHIRIKAQDNPQHITDFESAADHTQTEAKWRQMGIPIVMRKKRNSISNSDNEHYGSAYDDNIDHTDAELTSPDANRQQQTDRVRWKHKGPWIGGMQEGEFAFYLDKQISSRQDEFHEFLRGRLLDLRVSDERRRLQARGESMEITSERRAELETDIKENFSRELQLLREDHASQQLGSELAKAIRDFLDLPAVLQTNAFTSPAKTAGMDRVLNSIMDDSTGPPSTHPAAGLSHLRTHAYMDNHPLYGPQEVRSPVLARVLQPRNSSMGQNTIATLGVGGIATKDHSNKSTFRAPPADGSPQQKYLDIEAMTSKLDAQLWGGNKTWVNPVTASLDANGRIVLDVVRAPKEAISVATNDVRQIHEARRSSFATSDPRPAPGTHGNANFGTALPNMMPSRRQSRVQGFDREFARSSSQRSQSSADVLQKLQSLHRREAKQPSS